MAVTANVQVMVTGKHTSALDLGTAELGFAASLAAQLASGTGSGQVDRVFTDQRTLSASANEDLDLAAALTDAFGATITFAKVKAILIIADAGNTNNVQVTRPGSNGVPAFLAAGDGVAIKPGGAFLLYDPVGITVTAGTGDLINVANSGGSTGVTYKVIILGTSA